MDLDFQIEGLDKLLNACDQLKRPSAVKRVMTAALTGGLNAIGKQMKKDLSPRVKVGRSSVKSRILYRGGKVTAKVGFGVGKRRKKSDKQKIGAALKKKMHMSSGKGGVGIGANNISWWVAGTKKRHTGKEETAGHDTGAMPAMQPKLASIAYQKGKGKIHSEMIRRGALALTKEVAKLKK